MATLAHLLGNVFINDKGEVCRNLQTSKSKVAESLRRRRAVEEANRLAKQHAQKIKQHLQKCEQLRCQGITLAVDDPARVQAFKQAAWHENRSKVLRAKIIEINTKAREG